MSVTLTDEQAEQLIRLMRKPEEYLAHIIKMQRVKEYEQWKQQNE